MAWGNKNSKTDAPLAGLTKETQAILGDVMAQRGLSKRAMQDVAASVARGDSNWVSHVNSGTSQQRAPSSKTNVTVKAPSFRIGPPEPALPPLGSFSGKKMNVVQSQREQYVGSGPAPNRDVEKDRLARVMELGVKGMQEMDAKLARMKAAALESGKACKQQNVKEAMIDQVIEEIKERREFLEAMQQQGRAAQYEAQVKGDIAQRLKELERMGLDVRR